MTYQKAYNEIMSHITLSAPAQERIRQRLRTEASRSPRHSVWRAMLPAACLALMLTAGIFLALSRQTSTPPTGLRLQWGIPDPIRFLGGGTE